jgi:hypothetical protein
MKVAIGLTLVFGTIVMFIWNSVPRLMSDLWHSREFIPAQSHTITDYKCTTWNLFMFNDCTVTFVPRQGGASRQITDWRFGWAPSDPIHLLQRRDDASSITTDVSLRTLWNRVLVALTLILFGLFLALGLIASAFKTEDEPAGAPSKDAPSEDAPAFRPTGRATFGKRQA